MWRSTLTSQLRFCLWSCFSPVDASFIAVVCVFALRVLAVLMTPPREIRQGPGRQFAAVPPGRRLALVVPHHERKATETAVQFSRGARMAKQIHRPLPLRPLGKRVAMNGQAHGFDHEDTV